MTARVGDFGLAKFLLELMNPKQGNSIGIRGTIGYTAPSNNNLLNLLILNICFPHLP